MSKPSSSSRSVLGHLCVLAAVVAVGPPTPDETVRDYGIRVLAAIDPEDELIEDLRFRVLALLDLEAS